MLQFHIQADSEIPASKQLLEQIQFAIASGQYLPGHRLPSTRQLAMMTGLHRNTISKVYRQLEETGLVESLAGSGIYVKVQEPEGKGTSPLLKQFPKATKLIQASIDRLLAQGCTLSQIQELFLAEIDWRKRCSARVVVTVPTRDIFAGELVHQELEQALEIPVELVALEDLTTRLGPSDFATVVTLRYFIGEVLAAVAAKSARVIPIDIYDYVKELEIVKHLPKEACLGIVSLSKATLGVAETIVHSLRGDELLIMTAQASDGERLQALVRSTHTIISDSASYATVKQAVLEAREHLIRPPDVICSANYIGDRAINLLKQELDLASSPKTS
ncbi:MAG: GntR family transcriptional regulator [Cyanophyceae cyanobacterium]